MGKKKKNKNVWFIIRDRSVKYFLEPSSNHPSPDLPPKMSYLLKCLPPRIKSKFEASLEVQLRSIIKITEYVPLIPDLINHLKKIRTKLNNFDIWPPRLSSRFLPIWRSRWGLIIKMTEDVPLILDLINHFKKIRNQLNNFYIWPPRTRSRLKSRLRSRS